MLASRRTVSRSLTENRSSGTTPSTTAIKTESPSVKAIALPFTPISLMRGKLRSFKLSSNLTPQNEITTPSAPATSTSSRFSVINCRAMRRRVAPSAARTANSRCRVVTWANSRFATFAQATINRNPTAPKIINRALRTFRTMYSCCGTRAKSTASVSLPCSCLSCFAICVSSAFACSIPMLSRNRATTLQL